MVLGVLVLGPRIDVVMGALALSIAVTLVLLFGRFRACRRRHAAPKLLPPAMADEMRRYAIPLVPIALMNWFTSVSDRYIIAWFSHDTFMVGVYAVRYGLVSQPPCWYARR